MSSVVVDIVHLVLTLIASLCLHLLLSQTLLSLILAQILSFPSPLTPFLLPCPFHPAPYTTPTLSLPLDT